MMFNRRPVTWTHPSSHWSPQLPPETSARILIELQDAVSMENRTFKLLSQGMLGKVNHF